MSGEDQETRLHGIVERTSPPWRVFIGVPGGKYRHGRTTRQFAAVQADCEDWPLAIGTQVSFRRVFREIRERGVPPRAVNVRREMDSGK